MAGHSQFKNIMHRKGAQDKKRAKLFSKLAREITVSAKMNPDPEANPRLRAAIAAARVENIPKDNIERAMAKATGVGDDANYDEMRYEGYGAGGVAVIVEALTDNRNRTASEVRSTFTKYGGNLGETNSVSFMFDHVGIILYKPTVASSETMFEAALEAGAQDVISSDEGHEIVTALDDLHAVAEVLTRKFGDPEAAKLAWKSKTNTPIDEEKAISLFKMIDALEDNDDVQSVFANYEVSDAILEKLTA